MSYMDEKIVKSQRMEERKKYCTIETGIYVDDVLIEFEHTYIEELGFTVALPDTYVSMPESMKKSKYISENRPQVIMTSLDTSVNFTFSLLPVNVPKEQLILALKQMRQVIQKINPANTFYGEKVVKLESGESVYYFDYMSYALDCKMYNVMYLTALADNKVLHGGFNCKFDFNDEWSKVVSLIMKTIRIGDVTGGCENDSK